MPEPGFKTITVSDDFFNKFDALYEKNKKCATLDPGICSFTAYFIQQLEVTIKEKIAMTNFVSKIQCVPDKFTETKLLIKQSKP